MSCLLYTSIDETQRVGDFDITLLGLTSGQALVPLTEGVNANRTYACLLYTSPLCTTDQFSSVNGCAPPHQPGVLVGKRPWAVQAQAS